MQKFIVTNDSLNESKPLELLSFEEAHKLATATGGNVHPVNLQPLADSLLYSINDWLHNIKHPQFTVANIVRGVFPNTNVEEAEKKAANGTKPWRFI
jgi:hypothetical protein